MAGTGKDMQGWCLFESCYDLQVIYNGMVFDIRYF